MKFAIVINTHIVFGLFAFALTLALSHASRAQSPRAVVLPEQCSSLRVPEGNSLAHRVYASGVQIYWWNGERWGFVAPMADLYASPGFQGYLGRHYGGPTWRSVSGGLVIGERESECSPDPDSIPWLRLRADEVDGVGMFSDTTFIQRINTSGGKVPNYPGTYDGEEVQVAYTAEYYFYRAVGSQPMP